MQLTFPQREVSPLLSPAPARPQHQALLCLLVPAVRRGEGAAVVAGPALVISILIQMLIYVDTYVEALVDTIIDTTAIASIHNNRLHFTRTT